MSPEQLWHAPILGVYFHRRGAQASKTCGAPGALSETQPFRLGCFEFGFLPIHSLLSPTKHTLSPAQYRKERAKAGEREGPMVPFYSGRDKEGASSS